MLVYIQFKKCGWNPSNYFKEIYEAITHFRISVNPHWGLQLENKI